MHMGHTLFLVLSSDSCGGREGLVKEGEREVFLESPPVSGALPYTAGERDSNTGAVLDGT